MRTLKLSDEVLCVRYSPNQNLIAVSLLDTTVKVFYHDTLKFFLSLYGHKVRSYNLCVFRAHFLRGSLVTGIINGHFL